jgi:hypothetical protein
MSWYGIDVIDKAFSRTRKALFEPFDFWKWLKLAIIIFFLGGISSNNGGSGTNYKMSPEELRNNTLGSEIVQGYFPHSIVENITSSITSFTVYGLLIALIAALILLFLLLFYISNVMEFVFVESLVKNEVKFWAYSRKFLGKGFNLLLVRLALLLIILVLLGIAALPFISNIIKTSPDLSWPALLGGLIWFFGVLIVLGLLLGIISSFISLAIPISIYRNTGILASLKLVFANFRKSWQQVLVYWVIRFVLGLVLGIAMLILVLLMLLVSGLVFLIIDGILYFLFSAFASEPWNWILLIPFIVIELLLLFGTLLLLSVPLKVFLEYHLLSFLESWFAGADIPFFDAPAAGTEIGLSGSEPQL